MPDDAPAPPAAELTVLFWDIDGTLLTTDRAGIGAWEEALRQCEGMVDDLAGFTTAGLTDHEIGRALLERHGRSPEASSVQRLVSTYETLLPAYLPRRRGSVIPGVVAILEAAQQRPDVRSMLLSGNTAAGARAKLHHYGLAGFFGAGGAFSDDAPNRPDIARCALARARRLAGRAGLRAVVIGDTPHDVRCGRAIGARVVAVATGIYPLADLTAEDPWWATPRLPDPAVFFGRLELPLQPHP